LPFIADDSGIAVTLHRSAGVEVDSAEENSIEDKIVAAVSTTA